MNVDQAFTGQRDWRIGLRAIVRTLLCAISIAFPIGYGSAATSVFTYTTTLPKLDTNGPITLELALYPSSKATGAITSILLTNVALGPRGEFSKTLDFGMPLETGLRRWIGIDVGGTNLPRRQVLLAPNGVVAELTANPDWYGLVSLGIGVLCVVVFALTRFNTPPSNRASTTAVRYWTAATLYGTAGMVAYFVLVFSPQFLSLVKHDAQGLPELVNNLTTPLSVALLLTVLLPNVPGLARADEKVREWFQTMAEIPRAARIFRQQLADAEFSVPEPRRTAVTKFLIEDEQFNPADIQFEAGRGHHQLWTKIAYLMMVIRKEKDEKLRAYHRRFSNEYDILCEHYESLKSTAREWFVEFREAGEKADKRLRHIQTHFLDDADALLTRIYTYISQALLQSQPGYRSRKDLLTAIGFEVTIHPPTLTLHQLAALFLLVSTVILLMFIYIQRVDDEPYETTIAKTIMIGFIYCVSVAVAVYPRNRWALARRAPGEARPWLFYIAAAGLGILAAFPVNAIYNYLIAGGVPSLIWERMSLKYPYLLIAGVTAGVTAWSNDNNPGATREVLYRILEGAVQAAIAGLVGLGIHAMLVKTHLSAGLPEDEVPQATVLVCVFATIGFIIGCCVPHWCRRVENRASSSRPPKGR